MLEVNAPSQIEALVSQVDGAVSIMMKQHLCIQLEHQSRMVKQ